MLVSNSAAYPQSCPTCSNAVALTCCYATVLKAVIQYATIVVGDGGVAKEQDF